MPNITQAKLDHGFPYGTRFKYMTKVIMVVSTRCWPDRPAELTCHYLDKNEIIREIVIDAKRAAEIIQEKKMLDLKAA